MKTYHKIFYLDSKKMNNLNDESIDLMITSPPYPMIKMWDEIFGSQNNKIKEALEKNNGELAFELMHLELDKVWKEVYRTLKKGGIACINIGDSTRTLNGKFQMYSNHSRILKYCTELGFDVLPSILWIKETNKPDKFMGSGMLPVGAYITLEHEHILILRKGRKKEFKNLKENEIRRRSAFFWEERNIWFSDKWNIKGIFQKLEKTKTRNRSGAYPFELSYRLINMFSIQGDTVLDPFLGTGTTTFSAMASGRNSIGFEIDSNFKEFFNNINKNEINQYIDKRITKHNEFIKNNKEMKYINKNYNFLVKTSQEKEIYIPKIKTITKKNNEELINEFEIEHYF